MKYVYLGIKDYFRDKWHDWLFRQLWKFYGRHPMYYENWQEDLIPVCEWQESRHISHYIKQRRIGHKRWQERCEQALQKAKEKAAQEEQECLK